MNTFVSSIDKKFIRSNWNKPLLNFLNSELGCKLIYFGLPSPSAEDIKEWIEYLSKVIAFQCRDYPHPSDSSQSKKYIIMLENILVEFERQGKLTKSVVYDGYIEEVILNARDNSNNDFSQDETVMIYNLDFCNQITSPINYMDKNGESKTAYKFQVIKEILQFQKNINQSSQKFIMFLTINARFNDDKINRFVETPENDTIRNIINKYSNISGINSNIRILRVFVIELLRRYFQNYEYIPLFLPSIHYKGTNRTNMMHFTIIGTKTDPGAGGIAPWYQRISTLCNQKFITINNEGFVKTGIAELNEQECNINPVNTIRRSKVFKEYWQL